MGIVANDLTREIRYAVRSVARAPVFAGVVVLTIALGIGSTAAVFSVADAMLVRGLPYRDSGHLFAVYEADDAGHFRGPSFPTFDDWHTQLTSDNHAVEGLAFVRGSGFSIAGPDGPEQHAAAYVTPGFFTLMGARALMGRTFVADEERPGTPAVAVLSYDFFEEHFGGDRTVLGRTLDVDSVQATVIGVMPRGFAFPNFSGPTWLPPALWLPIAVFQSRQNVLSFRGLHADSRTIVRLAPGADSARGVAVLRTIERRLEHQYPEQAHWTSVVLQPIGDELFGGVRPALVRLFVATLLVLMLACASVANLQLARASVRNREFAVRMALGAGRWRIARQLLAETLLLSTTAGALGVLLAFALTGVVRHAAGDRLPFATQIIVDRPVVMFAFVSAVVVALAIGILPAFRASGGPLVERLRSGAVSAAGGVRERRLRGLLVAVQFALALTLLVGAGLLLQSFRRLEAIPLGYDSTNLIAFTIAAPTPKYAEPRQAAALYAEILRTTQAIPTVTSTAAAGGALLTTNVEPDGWATDRPPPLALYHLVSADYLRTLRVPLIGGRWFSSDDMRSPVGFVVNEKLAKQLAPDGQIIGRRITVRRSSQARADFGQPITMPIVGIIADFHESNRATPPDPEVFLPYTLEVWPYMNFVVRAPDAARVLSAVIRAVHEVDPSIQFRGRPSVSERAVAGLVAPPFLTLVITGFAAFALAIAAIGLYGIVAYGVAQRTREVGIRLALGASERSILALMAWDGLLFVLVGGGVGLLGASAASRLLTSLLFDTKLSDPQTFVAVALLLLLVALTSSYVPARRAAKADPMSAMRIE